MAGLVSSDVDVCVTFQERNAQTGQLSSCQGPSHGQVPQVIVQERAWRAAIGDLVPMRSSLGLISVLTRVTGFSAMRQPSESRKVSNRAD